MQTSRKGITCDGRIAAVILLASLCVSVHSTGALASDLSEATELREKCEAQVKVLEVAARNFGDDAVLRDFQQGTELLRSAKVKMAQSKYAEAKPLYADYLKLQHRVYKGLASIYIKRAEEVFNEVTTELVDFIDNKKVDQYFKLANQNIQDARLASGGERYKEAVELCRNSKNYLFESYKAAGKATPEKYARDIKDINREIDPGKGTGTP